MPSPYDTLMKGQPKGPLAMSLEQRAQKEFGMNPEAQRLGLLPYPQGALSGQEGEVDWTNWVAPEIFYDMAKSLLLPGHVNKGGDWQESDVTQMYMDSLLGSGPAGAMTAGGSKLPAATTKLADTLTQGLEGAPTGNLPAVIEPTGPIQENLLDKPISRRVFLKGAKKAGEMVTAATNPMVQGLMKVLPETAPKVAKAAMKLPALIHDLPVFKDMVREMNKTDIIENADIYEPHELMDAYGVDDVSKLSESELDVFADQMQGSSADPATYLTQGEDDLVKYFEGELDLDDLNSQPWVVINELMENYGLDKKGVEEYLVKNEVLVRAEDGGVMSHENLDPTRLPKGTDLTSGGKGGVVIGAANALAPTYQGRLSAALEAMTQENWTKPQALGYLQNQVAKGKIGQAEVEYTGLKKMLLGEGKTTKAEMIQQVKDKPLELVDVKKGEFAEGSNPQIYEAFENDDGYWDVRNAHTGQSFLENITGGGDRLSPREAEVIASDGTAAGYLLGERSIDKRPGFGPGGKTEHRFAMHEGGENYRELLITLPTKSKPDDELASLTKEYQKYLADEGLPQESADELMANTLSAVLTPEQRSQIGKYADKFEFHYSQPSKAGFKDPHWPDDPDVLINAQIDTRQVNDEKTLVMLEGQSAYHQKGAKEGYIKEGDQPSFPGEHMTTAESLALRNEARHIIIDADNLGFDNADSALYHMREYHMQGRDWSEHWDPSNISGGDMETLNQYLDVANARQLLSEGSGKGVPDAPYKKNWPDLLMRRLIREAAETDHGRVAWFGAEAVFEKETGGSIKFFRDLYEKRFLQAAKKYGAIVEEVEIPVPKQTSSSFIHNQFQFAAHNREVYQVTDGQVSQTSANAMGDFDLEGTPPDGWYYLEPDGDADSLGPFHSREQAIAAGMASTGADKPTRKGYSFKVTPEMQTKIMTEGVLLSGGKGGTMAASLMQGMRPLGGSQDDLREQIRQRHHGATRYQPPPLRLKEVPLHGA